MCSNSALIHVWRNDRFGGTRTTSEQFNCAGRTIKTGLIAVDIVSHWTWAATLLQSSNVAWQYGVSGPFWCALVAYLSVLALPRCRCRLLPIFCGCAFSHGTCP